MDADCLCTSCFSDVPQIIFPEINKTVIVNEENLILINCSASGIPAPVISWFKVGQNGSAAINKSSSQVNNEYQLPEDRGTASLVTSQLTFPSAQDMDSGRYQCQSENSVGNATRQFELLVQSKDNRKFIIA